MIRRIYMFNLRSAELRPLRLRKISRAQYDKSLGDLIVKMGIKEEQEE